jgi:drug/metabolite transporter (DMT)-like permease
MSLLVRMSGGAGIPTMEVVFARSLVVLLLSWFFLRRRGLSARGEDRRLLFLRGVVGFISLSCFYFALVHLPLADATVIQYTNPVWTALLAAVLLAEPVGRKEIVLSVASLGGVVVMARPTLLFGGEAAGLPGGPVAVGVVGALFSGLAYVAVRRLAKSDHPLVVVYWFALISTLGSLPFVLRDLALPSGRALTLLLGVGVATYLGQVLITMGLREERAGRAMGVAYLQVVFAAAWGALVLGEVPDRWTFAGAAIILGCTWVLGRSRSPAI